MHKFFVVGLPRSRTYWLSIFLNCSHEAYFYEKNYNNFMQGKSFGDSTTCYSSIKYFITDEPIVVIDRNIKDSYKSSKKLFPIVNMPTLKMMKSDLDSIENPLIVKYDDINNRLEEIWNHCYESEFDKVRADKLKDIHMENYVLIESVRENLEYANHA